MKTLAKLASELKKLIDKTEPDDNKKIKNLTEEEIYAWLASATRK